MSNPFSVSTEVRSSNSFNDNTLTEVEFLSFLSQIEDKIKVLQNGNVHQSISLILTVLKTKLSANEFILKIGYELKNLSHSLHSINDVLEIVSPFLSEEIKVHPFYKTILKFFKVNKGGV